jgi:Ni/Co efflux regulator RcnB
MNRLLCAASVLALVIPSVASAQQQQQQQQNDRHRGQHARSATQNSNNAQRPNRPNRPSSERPTIQPTPGSGGHRPGIRPPSNERPSIQPVPSRPGHPNSNRPGRPSIQPVPNRPHQRPPNFRPIHRPGFHYPRGYHYRRWNIGLILPSIFLSNYYYFNDWNALGLYPPPPGYIWVRYGPDLLLVNRRTGRIRDVIYGAFY